MQTKFLWNDEQYNSIQWPAFNLAFQRLAPNERQFISKITHEWLPLQASHIMAKAMDQQNCPSCLNNRETPEHFLQCPHPIWQGIWEEFQQGLQKIYIKHNTPQPIQDIISEGYRLSRDPTRTTPTHIANQISVQEVVQHQANLGWKQLIYGRFTSAWTTLLHTQTPQTNSNNFLSKIIHHSWMVLITIWQIRNTHLHPPNNHLNDRNQLYALVEHIFHTVRNDPTLRDLLNYTTIDQIMQRSSRDINKWIKHSKAHIHAHQDGAQKRAAMNTNDIRSYFQPREQPPPPQTPNKNLLRPP